MLRLCSDSSRSYPGRSAPLCISQERRGHCKGFRDGAEVSRSHSRQGLHHSWRCGDWKRARLAGMDSPCRRAELEERDVILYELSWHVKPERVIAHGARHKEIQLPKIITVTAVFSKNWDWK